MQITDATKNAILNDLLNPTKPVEDIIRTFRDVCSEQVIHEVGTEAGIDWALRQRLQEALIRRDQLVAGIVEMENTFLDKVHRNDDDDDDYDRPVRRYRPYLRPRRMI